MRRFRHSTRLGRRSGCNKELTCFAENPIQTESLQTEGKSGMPLNLESLSDDAKTAYLARVAHTLTICARDTYEFGTEDVLNPQMLRAYNELLHQVIGSIASRLAGSQEQEPIEYAIEMIDLFGVERERVEEMNWALKYALQRCSRVPDQFRRKPLVR
jgi:hypothetical protein